MPRAETWGLVKEFLFPGRSANRSIPPLDGGFTPNDALEQVETALDGLAAPEDVCPGRSGDVYVSTGTTVVRRSGPGFTRHEVVATLPGPAGALALAPDGGLLVCVAGTGVVRVPEAGHTEVVVAAHCPTDLTVAADGTVYVTDGSTRHCGPDWIRDLMEQNTLGRLLRYDPRTAQTTVLASGLGYASGVTLTREQDALLVCEAWAHRVMRYPLDGGAGQPVRQNLPGYPGRINTGESGYWLAVFALRTLLVEFVLGQRDYVEEMMRTIEPDYWIRPALRSLGSGLEPLQGGQIRKLGVIKPWAPPRSYGLVAHLDDEGYVTASLHSRGGGRRHGVTSARQLGEHLFVAVHGADEVLCTQAGEWE
ncbi:SMP-30/gluconolactonase/LRE family protein [Amycolatopsis jejuensis]|uniref:SMP-30/gluconolactonase/LRE family protein n=1 Tax=Amycolatopsis jejuensis TaxID=330084 RepID=UPI0005248A64|nr:SMP-30/gluconolactonase/LRE family protein [Amycolatopsis jejuensis]